MARRMQGESVWIARGAWRRILRSGSLFEEELFELRGWFGEPVGEAAFRGDNFPEFL